MFLKKGYWLKLIVLSLFLVFSIFSCFASVQTLVVHVNESVLENGSFSSNGIWSLTKNLEGKIYIQNVNPTETISDIYVFFDNASNIDGVDFFSGINGSVIGFGGDDFLVHVPQLQPGNVSVWNYSISSSVLTPLLFNTSYSSGKILTGESFTVYDEITNQFNNASYQSSCISNINIVQNTMLGGNSSYDPFLFSGVTAGSDSGNVVYSGGNRVQTWNVLGGACLNKADIEDINYVVDSPFNTSGAKLFNFSNTTISYLIDDTVSQLRVKKIEGIGDGNLTISKTILSPAHPTLYGRNVTWQLNGSFETDTNLEYDLLTSTFWVSQRDVDGLYTNISKIDVDGITGADLELNLIPSFNVNSTTAWLSSNWLFNYSDSPSPITWMSVNFTLANDGIQLVNSSSSNSEDSLYFKQIVVISGYLLEIEKNITSVGTDEYNIKIKIFNRGNQITPSGSVVTVYDFVPDGFVLSSPFVYNLNSWYNTVRSNNSVNGHLNGTLQRWALIPTNSLNASLASGPIPSSDNVWTAEFNITGSGEYHAQDVFITGLDPQKVDGAGAAASIIVENYYNEETLFNTIFACIAGFLGFVLLLV